MNRDTVVRAGWWADLRVQALGPAERLVLLLLASRADRDGIAEADTAQLVSQLGAGCSRMQVVGWVRASEAAGLLALYQHAGRTWVWLVRHADDQPHSGALAQPRCTDRPAPPREAVVALLERQLGRAPKLAESKRLCPRAWGLVREATGIPTDDVARVWEAWRARQQRPAGCHLGDAVARMVRGALAVASADQLVALVEYAYEADEPAARFWRGQNDHQRTYLGLDNLLRLAKLSDRLVLVEAWQAQRRPEAGDGTDLGPLAAYRRRGPAGTTTTPDPRPLRLSAQCAVMLRLFVERGDDGVHTRELADIALKYSSRISELRGLGADIVVVERNEDGDNLYALLNPLLVGNLLTAEVTDGMD